MLDNKPVKRDGAITELLCRYACAAAALGINKEGRPGWQMQRAASFGPGPSIRRGRRQSVKLCNACSIVRCANHPWEIVPSRWIPSHARRTKARRLPRQAKATFGVGFVCRDGTYMTGSQPCHALAGNRQSGLSNTSGALHLSAANDVR